MQDPRTLFIVPESHVKANIEEKLMPHMTGSKITLYERSNLAHYGDCGEHADAHLRSLISRASHVVVVVGSNSNAEQAMLHRLFGYHKPLGLMVISSNPEVYDQLGRTHKKHARFKVIATVGGPNRVEQFFSRGDGKTPVVAAFDLDNKPWLLLMDFFHRLWN